MSFEEDHELLWAVLLDYIEEGTVVPVLGRDLLEVETAEGAPRVLCTASSPSNLRVRSG